MLYISTRNNVDTYTAFRALCNERSPDGGYFVPFYLPSFSLDALKHFKSKPAYDTIAEILNLFFSLRLTAADIEQTIGNPALSCESLNQNILVAELWHTPEGNSDYIFKKLNYLMTGNLQLPVGWTRIAIEISLLFCVYGIISIKEKALDVAVAADDLASITAISFAKAMGLPIGLTICSCEDNSFLWDFINKGECCVSSAPAYTELFLYKLLGGDALAAYLAAADKKRSFCLDDASRQILACEFYPAVVSGNRADSIITGMYRSNHYALDIGAALAYGGLQDYRAIVGVNKNTLIFANNRPERIKE